MEKALTTKNQSISKIPSLAELIQESEESIKENYLMVLLNQDPPKSWLSEHPNVKVKNNEGKIVPALYLPINRVEYLLSRIFGKWWVEVRSTSLMANNVTVTVRVFVINPVTKETDWNDGIGAAPVQPYKEIKSIQMALPAAESYAIKDACEKWGKLFGKDLNRNDIINYDFSLNETPIKEHPEEQRKVLMIQTAKTLEQLEKIGSEVDLNPSQLDLFNQRKEELSLKKV